MKEEFWKAIVECDPNYDQLFFYGLSTTGIFCKPSCKSRTPKREHVKIYYAASDAIAAGFRPCKRCRPSEPTWKSAEEDAATRLLEMIHDCYNQPVTLREMASRLYVSPFYLQRCFSRCMKITPGKYLTRIRIDEAKKQLLETDRNVSMIASRVGFRNSAYFAAVFQKETGCTPTQYRLQQKKQGKTGTTR
ncbi:methylphosphotriester-DNA--protein-cysteine methyltransferase family protein [Brevibacillus sp. 7WMA2]|uniref:Methylphosphotriester-DNA--protein-cysteine S-methyltransferase n=3 Tax=Brevibacillus TaxID=55080 RepID=A0A075R7F1_BRELA|nr:MULTISPECIES: Ada metal-binding domain-containing protein [Brevibacillus]HAS01223.1 AraC family transcriptional regulator [Brevibacillus sp.]AIG25525.1 methylphosphotriester-DNA--protein-cysteine S-methyltransferase [Brevibacillus laterosporus LMG 15441]AKF92298.1 AraC family transcriptional regulator [Brevibacillus laterosporus]AUM64086.1 AraC family transcriptional regulator [Brevibacillus laterosporus]AYK07070.1 helix-turn-helix domain-containing protein [Brevibacillus laterosporus]